jgi:hypothetical protein
VLYIILTEFGIPMKLDRLIKMCLNKIYSRVCIGKNLSEVCPKYDQNLDLKILFT